ncbi:MAG: hypothetical protein M9921_02350 [Fimbriimonadaceae bacterium]|nr:hypothetical protein [Chthonomonadaceae bacterium]MCO5295674.1 hypothetical protein [Fimbriimonadaceae bacterium]
MDLAKRRVAADPTHLGHLEELARLQWSDGDCSGLIDTLRRLTALNPFEPGYHFLRGAALQCLGMFGDALTAYDRCARFTDSKLAEDARAAASELRRWPREIVSRLAEADLAFRHRYERDPEGTWRMLGFKESEEESPGVRPMAPDAQFRAIHRPS